jgi:hypothetical protein
MGFSVFPQSSGGSAAPTIKQTFNSSTSNVAVPAGTNIVYAIVVAGGQGGRGGMYESAGEVGAAGGVTFGITAASPVVVVGSGGGGGSHGYDLGGNFGSPGGSSRYGTLTANSGGSRYSSTIDFFGFNGSQGFGGAAGPNPGYMNESNGGTGGSGSVTLIY